MTLNEALERAIEIEADMKKSGTWDKVDSFWTTEGGYLFIKEGDKVMVHSLCARVKRLEAAINRYLADDFSCNGGAEQLFNEALADG